MTNHTFIMDEAVMVRPVDPALLRALQAALTHRPVSFVPVDPFDRLMGEC